MRFVQLLALSCVLALGAVPGHAWPGKKRDQRPVRDLHYGEVLFHYYQQDYFGAITRLLAAEQQGRLSTHRDDARLLLGGMYVSYGQQADAERIFDALLDADPRPEVRDRAWFHLARIAYQRGQPERAGRSLERIGDRLPAQLDARRELLASRLLMDAGDFAAAAERLRKWDAPQEWQDYARFNLGVALVRNGEVERGSRYLQRIGAGKLAPDRVGWAGRLFTPWRMLFREGVTETDRTYEEHQALMDKANVALGFAYLQDERPEQARRYLARVAQDSPWGPRALLGTGWALAAEGDYDAALDPWERLQAYDPFDPAVQEAHLAVPYALGKLEDYPRAAARYTAAIDSFNDEMARLDRVADATFDGGFLAGLLGNVEGDDLGWFWQLERLPDTAETRYLYRLLAEHGFQEALKNYRDLHLLRANLAQWREGVDAYRDMLATRLARFEERVALMNASLQSGRLERLDARSRALHERLSGIEHGNEAAGLATAGEIELMALLARVEQRLAGLPADTGRYAATIDELREKHRVLRGVLEWRLAREFPVRYWERSRALGEVDEALAEAHRRTEALLAAREGAAERLAWFSERVDAIAPRIDALITRIDTLAGSHGEYIHALALATLEQRRDRLRAYLTEAQYALASVYDSAVHGDAP